MKKVLALSTFLLALATFALAQKGPVANFDVTTIDYGVIEQGADPYRVFKFTNTGDQPLVIKNAKGSCGCTVPEWPKQPIEPGQSAEIKVKYDTNRAGTINKNIKVYTNAQTEPLVLQIKGEVKPKKVEPGAPAAKPSILGGSQ